MQSLLRKITRCTVCAVHLPHGVRPVVAASDQSRIVVIGQAPGRRVNESGIQWNDPSGDNLRNWLGEAPIVRCMPNTPSLVQAGATGLYAAPDVSAEQKEMAGQILSAVGLTFWFETEGELDAVTAVSGSGPAYFFLLMEALIDAARAQGLSATTARQLVLQTAWGASQLAITSEDGPDVLRQRVTSPGGTTAAALQVFEEAGLREQVQAAVAAARERSEQLSG